MCNSFFRLFFICIIASLSLSSLGNAGVLTPTLNWDAAEDSSSQYWDSTFNGAALNQHNSRRWNFGSDVTADDASGSNFSELTKSYDTSATMNSFEQMFFANCPTEYDATFEFIIRPSDFEDKHNIFETGSGDDGTSLLIDGSQIVLTVSNLSDQNAPTATLTTTLAAPGVFYDILFTIDVTNDLIELFVDGSSRGSSNFGGEDLHDWAGTDSSGLLGINNALAGGQNGFSAETQGDIAIMRFYQDNILNQSEIDDNFAAMGAGPIPEPSSIALWSALGIIGLAVARRKRKLTRAA
jgi:hypothetical protein